MSKVTSKLQVTIPKTIAERYRIRPGDDIEWAEGDEVIRIQPRRRRARRAGTRVEQLRCFDDATKRQARRQQELDEPPQPTDRGWTREELHDRAGSR
ncbi:MAG: AbrB/MazE/SpoVT family DNA-binding domain-containing protein [Candidatus Riflebacteria bacterium]|nr:AbrB/MazE/SpoVT family DNA-binding domain-containing protein [Candidatus Riflebacteria bacterium]